MSGHWLLPTFLAVGTLLAFAEVTYDISRIITGRGPSGIPVYVIYATCFAIPTALAGVGLLTGSVWLDLMLFTGSYLVIQLSLYKFSRVRSRRETRNRHP